MTDGRHTFIADLHHSAIDGGYPCHRSHRPGGDRPDQRSGQAVRCHCRMGLGLMTDERSPGRPPRFEGDELDTLISHYQDGWTTTELAEEFNTSTGTISTTLSRAGITARPRGRPRLFSD